MYISRDGDEAAGLAAALRGRGEPSSRNDIVWTGDDAVERGFDAGARQEVAMGVVARRSSDPLQRTNTSIGIAVGVVLGVFLIAVVVFLYRYPHALRFGRRKRRHHHGSRKGSKTSSSDGGDAAPAPEEAAPAEAAAPAPA